MTSTVNHPPSDLSEVVLKFDANGSVRIRTDDEATTDGQETVDYSYYIVCCAIGVSCHACSARAPVHALRVAIAHVCVQGPETDCKGFLGFFPPYIGVLLHLTSA